MEQRVQCCIAGGGPAGLMLGVLLARAGVRVTVLEKHGDFLRDFRGDTIHPSTLEVMSELGWLDDLLKLPHQPVHRMNGQFGSTRMVMADLSRLPVRAPFIAMMPQWDFLTFLAKKGESFATFRLLMRTEARGLVIEDGEVRGVTALGSDGPTAFRADLVVAADGRASTLRAASGLETEDVGAPMDVLWFGLPRRPEDTDETLGRFDAGRIFVMLNRGDYWQCAFVIPKGANDKVRADGLDAFRRSVAALLPIDPNRAREIKSLDDVKLLTVKVDRLKQWARPGLLCIGDAAHAMSPLGGVGINLAIQDAVAAANILGPCFAAGRVPFAEIEKVQARRQWPTVMTQRMQVFLQNTIVASALAAKRELTPPLALRIITGTPWLNRLPARILGLGFRPEHVANAQPPERD